MDKFPDCRNPLLGQKRVQKRREKIEVFFLSVVPAGLDSLREELFLRLYCWAVFYSVGQRAGGMGRNKGLVWVTQPDADYRGLQRLAYSML